MSDTTKSVDELRNQISDTIFPPSEDSAVGRLEYRGGVGVHQTGDFMVTGNFEPAIDRLVQLFTKQLEEAEIRARQQLKVNVFTQFRLAMQKQGLSPRPPKGARFRTPLEELSLILEANAPLEELATLTQDTKGGTDEGD